VRVLVCATVVCVTASARAQPEWSAPEGCPDAEEFRARVEQHRDAPVEALPARVVITVAADGRWQARVMTEHGTRAIDGARCDEVADAAALVVALMLEEAEEPEEEEEEEESGSEAASTSVGAKAEGTGFHLAVRTLAGGDMGSLPHATPALATGVALARGPLEVELLGTITAESEAQLPSELDAGGDIRLMFISARACYHRSVALCAGGELGSMDGQGFGVVKARGGNSRWLAVTVGIGYRVQLADSVSVFGRIDGVLPIARPRFVLADSTEVHTPAALGGRGYLGLEWKVF
jgi:hypothetical protein